MARSGKLRPALERAQGKDVKKTLQKKHMKEVEKKKRKRQEEEEAELEGEDGSELEEHEMAALENALNAGLDSEGDDDLELSEDEDEEDGGVSLISQSFGALSSTLLTSSQVDISRLNESDSDSADEEDDAEEQLANTSKPRAKANGVSLGVNKDHDEEEEEEDEEEDDIPLSDLEDLQGDEDDDADIIPHQRLTINNTTALARSLASIALPSSLPFSENMALTTDTPTDIPDIDDDLNREASFYAQNLESARRGRALLRKEGVPFTRPSDYFAEMVKSDEHMGKVKGKLIEEAANKKAAQDARAQRDLKKFGKQVQQEKLKERAKQKKDMLENVKALKRKRQQGGGLQTATEEDLFDVALEDAAETERKEREERRRKVGAKHKREGKDKKYGFGGKKRFAKSGDAESSADMRGFSTKKMKAGAKAGAKRPGKAKRRKLNM